MRPARARACMAAPRACDEICSSGTGYRSARKGQQQTRRSRALTHDKADKADRADNCSSPYQSGFRSVRLVRSVVFLAVAVSVSISAVPLPRCVRDRLRQPWRRARSRASPWCFRFPAVMLTKRSDRRCSPRRDRRCSRCAMSARGTLNSRVPGCRARRCLSVRDGPRQFRPAFTSLQPVPARALSLAPPRTARPPS